MKKNHIISAILTMCLMLTGAVSFTACSGDDLDTNQYNGGVGLNVYGPTPVMRGGTLRFLGSNLDQISQIEIPGVAPITNIEVVKAGVPSEIRIVVPHDGPQPGLVKLTTKTGETITTITELNYIEGLNPANITISPASAMAGDKIRITVPENGDEYLDIIHMVEFAEGVFVGESDFTAHSRYLIELTVPEEAKTGKLNLYTADLTNTEVDADNVEYQIITTEKALEVGVPTITKFASPRGEANALGTITVKAGETVTITGEYLSLVDAIEFGNQLITEFKREGKTVSATLPAEAPDGDINIVTLSGVEVPVGKYITVKPSEVAVAPNPVKAGAELTITGKDLDVVTSVEFPNADAQSGEAITVAADKIVVKAVPEKAIDGNITLRMANGAGVEVAYTLVKPIVTGYDKTTVSAGGTLTIQGKDLDLVKSVKFGESDNVIVANATSETITLTVPMNATSGAPTLTLANGTTVEGVPAINIEEAVFCYATALPGDDAELKAGNAMTLTVANSDKLTGVEMNGVACQWILTGDNKDQLIIGIPETASASSQLRLISSNGEITYDIAVIPATSVNKTVWAGLTQLTWNDGGRVLIPATAFDGVPAGAILTFCYTQVDGQWDQAQVNYGNWSGINFNEAGEGVVTFNQTLVPTDVYGWFTDGILSRETSVILTQEILDNIKAYQGGAEGGDGYGIIIQGSGLTFSKVTISYEISLEQNLQNCIVKQEDQSTLMPFPVKMTWDDSGRFRILIDKDPAIKDMKLVAGKSAMYFYTTGTGQLQINNPNWTTMTTVAEWNDASDKKMELILTDDIISCLKGVTSDGWSSTGLIIQGDGMTVSKITILP
jgi:hypothetical protein